jgi:D-aminopeptidase
MRVHIISDMEGVAGIVRPEQTVAGEALYEEGRKLYTE